MEQLTATSLQRKKTYLFIRGLLVISGGFIANLSIGTVFTFGNVAPYIVSYIRNESHPADLTQGTATWIYALNFIGQGCTMTLGGWAVKRIGPRWTTLIGGLVMSTGVGLTYFTIQISFWLVLLTYGLMFGAGVGMAYTGPIYAAMKWLPNWKGLANGIILAGIGLGSLVYNAVQTFFVNPHNLPAEKSDNGEDYFTDPHLIHRVPHLFLVLCGSYAAMQVIGSLLLTNPPEGYGEESADMTSDLSVSSKSAIGPKLNKHDSDHLIAKTAEDEELRSNRVHGATVSTNYSGVPSSRALAVKPLEMLKKPSFYALWFAFLFNGTAMQFTVTLYKFFGLGNGIGDHFLAMVGSVSSIFNFLGRIFWGLVADRVSHKFALVLLSSIMTVFLLTIYIATQGSKWLFLIWVCALTLCLGGNFSVFPTTSVKIYGMQYFSLNYGLLYTSQSIAGCVGALLSTFLKTHLNYAWLFVVIGTLSGAGLVSSIVVPHRSASINSKN
jgi:MFS family permease